MRVLVLIALVLTLPCRVAADSPSSRVPDFAGIDRWINSPPLSMARLRGKVVLIDFWAYSCINCLRALPHVEHLYRAYKDKGLVVIGVHSPEYDFEKDPGNVEKAVRRLGITYPVAMDNDHSTWKAWKNRYWPAQYLIDQNGMLIGRHYGEGGYRRMENAVRVLLGLKVLPGGDASSGFVPGKGDTPELHLGSAAQRGFGSPEDGRAGTRRFRAPGRLPLHKFALVGLWKITPEYARMVGSSGELRLHCKAAKVYMVAGADHPVTVKLTVDGKPQAPVTVEGSRQYTLFESRDDREHLLVLRIPQSHLRVFSFTFG